jgi:hypothetical protein
VTPDQFALLSRQLSSIGAALSVIIGLLVMMMVLLFLIWLKEGK